MHIFTMRTYLSLEKETKTNTGMHKGATGMVGKYIALYTFPYIYLCLLELHIGSDIQCGLVADTVAIAEVSPCIQPAEIVLAQGYPIP